eukprot:Sspe_Gene.118466::Locus_111986_Transcript_1_1_Confidence_1.000_Length_504::g.118466::m.118466
MLHSWLLWGLWVATGWFLGGHRIYLTVELVRWKELRTAKECIAWAVVQFASFTTFAWLGQYLWRHRLDHHTTEYEVQRIVHYTCLGCCGVIWLVDGMYFNRSYSAIIRSKESEAACPLLDP